MEGKHILLVDDDRDFVELMTLRLQSHDFQVSQAYSAAEALEKIKDKPDLVLLDIILPDVSGYKVCQRLRQDEYTHHIPIIMLTAKDAPEEKIEGFYIGADDYITKPFEAEELFARIEAVLRRQTSFEARQKDRHKLIEELRQIIQQKLFTTYFQPIFYLNPRKILGVEVLSRPEEGSYFKNPEILFDAAFHFGMLFDLEMAAHKQALVKLGDLVNKSKVFFNISPYLVQDDKFKEFSSFYGGYAKPENIVLELTERTVIKDFEAFCRTLRFFKGKGFNISVDDIGSGYASLNSIVEIRPEFIKINMRLARDVHIDKVRQNLLRAIVAFCKDSGIISIVEGVQAEEELKILIEFGVDAAQGYLLGRPTAEIKDIIGKEL